MVKTLVKAEKFSYKKAEKDVFDSIEDIDAQIKNIKFIINEVEENSIVELNTTLVDKFISQTYDNLEYLKKYCKLLFKHLH